MTDIVVHDWSLSPFLRAVPIALNEKGVAHAVREMTPPDAATEAFRAKSSFGKVPVVEHAGLVVRETAAILHCIEACFPARPLRPEAPAARSRVEGLMLAVANYLYPTGVMGVFFRHAYVAANGGVPIPLLGLAA